MPRYDLEQVRAEMKARVEAFCHTFLPGGRVDGPLYRCGGINGGEGKSFVVHLTGEKQGLFYENNPNGLGPRSGDLISLFMEVNGISSFGVAIQRAVEWMGLNSAVSTVRPRIIPRGIAQDAPKKEFHKSPNYKRIAPGMRAFDYLVGERGLKPEVLERWQIGAENVWFPQRNECPSILFPIHNPKGELCGMKYLAVERVRDSNGKMQKLVRSEAGSEYHLIGIPAIPADATELLICEGEIDAMSMAGLGFNAVSVPFGAKADGKNGVMNQGNRWIENDYEWLEKFTDIKVLMDNDEAGKAAADTIVRRLGAERCAIVRLPEGIKDANELLLSPDHEPEAIIRDAKPQDPEKLARAADLRQAIYDEFFGDRHATEGFPLPWEMPFHIRMGELSVFSGFAKHGKTVNLTHLVVDLCSRYDLRCGICSLEMAATKTLRNSIRQLTGRAAPKNEYGEPDMALFNRAIEWLNEHFYIYDAVGVAKLEDILSVFTYCAKRYGVNLFIIDSLMRLSVSEDDFEAQKNIMNRLSLWARELNVHLFLVAHSKKPTDKQREESYIPSQYDIKGSSAIPGIAHNVVVVFRNTLKERKINEARNKRNFKEVNELQKTYDAAFCVRNQREGQGERPLKLLWFDSEGSWQFRDKYEKPIINYLENGRQEPIRNV